MYPLDAVYDVVEDVPEDVKTNKRYAGLSGFTIQEVSDQLKADYGKVRVQKLTSTNAYGVGNPCICFRPRRPLRGVYVACINV